MSAETVDEPLSTSYDFCDAKDSIIVTLYAHGAFEVKDIDILIETDLLEVHTPVNEIWRFQLWEHIHADRSEIQTTINSLKTQTSVEIRLIKQQSRTPWPQLYSYNSIPITPQPDIQVDDYDTIMMSINEQQPIELSIKQLKTDFSETHEKFTYYMYVKHAYDCQVKFTETNFTAIFYTNDSTLLKAHNITSNGPLKLFARVKERIIPNKCSFKLTSTFIELSFVKENPSSSKWGRLEPSPYSEPRQAAKQTPTNAVPLTTTTLATATTTNTNKAIPLPPPLPPSTTVRKSDNYPSSSAFTSSIQQKDQTKVSPVQPSMSLPSFGYTGIYNPANSCFMNAAIQCLSNTRELRDYFLQSCHLSEINRSNPLGMSGAMAEEFGVLIQNLWCGKYNWANANKLRLYAAKRHQEFVGSGQHDAQELLTILLDAIHEDLNRIIHKPQVPPVEDQGRSDHIVADEFWRGHLKRNDSIIVQLFTGQFKSKTKCPQCQKESITFDPFTSISVPLPKRTAVDVIVTYRSDNKPSMKFRIIMSADGFISELKRNLSVKCGLSINKMIAYRIRGNRMIDLLKNDDRLNATGNTWNNNDVVYVTETLTSAECNNEPIVQLTFIQRIFKLFDYVSSCGYCQAPPNPYSSFKACPNCYQVWYCDEKCQKLHFHEHNTYCGFRSSENYETIGIPFIISLPESKLTCRNVFEQINIYAKRSVDINIERFKRRKRSFPLSDDYDRVNSGLDGDDEKDTTTTTNNNNNKNNDDDDDNDAFSDMENVDWPKMKTILSSSDSWSICRLGDYFVKVGSNKRRHGPVNSSNSNTEKYDTLSDIYRNEPLFRLMPQSSSKNIQSIVEEGADGDKILHHHTTFSIDWYTDNKPDAPLRVVPSKHRHGINGLVDDDSVYNVSVGDQDLTLEQCLQMFIEPEVLGPDDKWYCPNCKEHMQAEKIMSVWRLPPVLIIHLKRFKYHHGSSYGYFSDSRTKIDANVRYPVYGLNMSPYCSSSANASQAYYDLFGTINHRGSAWFGHYTSNARLLSYNDAAKTEIRWRNFDDEHVSSLYNEKEVIRSDTYVLFYRHRNLPISLIMDGKSMSPLSMDTSEYEETMESATNRDIRDLVQ